MSVRYYKLYRYSLEIIDYDRKLWLKKEVF